MKIGLTEFVGPRNWIPDASAWDTSREVVSDGETRNDATSDIAHALVKRRGVIDERSSLCWWMVKLANPLRLERTIALLQAWRPEHQSRRRQPAGCQSVPVPRNAVGGTCLDLARSRPTRRDASGTAWLARITFTPAFRSRRCVIEGW